jgi:hypothetical protein
MTIRPVSIISTHQTINMAVSHEYDWSAYNDDTFCGCDDCHNIVGHGKTEAEAIAEFLEEVTTA